MSAEGRREAKSRKMPGRAGLQEATKSRYRAEAARKESESAARAPHWSANLGPQGRSAPSREGPFLSLPTQACWYTKTLVKDHPGSMWARLWVSTKAVGPPVGVQGVTIVAPRTLGSRAGAGPLLHLSFH